MPEHEHEIGGAARAFKAATIGTQTLRALRRYPDRVAFRWEQGELRYSAVIELIGRLQRVFAGAGLRRGQRVAFLTGNDAVCWCASVAAQASGMAITWLHPAGSHDDHCFQIRDSEATALILNVEQFRDRAGQLAAAFADRTLFAKGGSEVGVDLMAAAEAVGTASPVDIAHPHELAILNYTGGTTGRSKGVMRSQSAFAAYTDIILAAFEFPDTPHYLAIAPMTHVGGTKFMPTLARGGTVRLTNGFAPDKVFDIVGRERANMTLLVPTMIYALLDDPGLAGADLRSLALLIYGAAPALPSRLMEGIERFGPIFSQLYGQTEGYPLSVLRRADHDPANPELLTSCGFPIASTMIQLTDDAGNAVEPGAVGEICARGPCIMDGYWKQPELTAQTLANDWLHTGDVGRTDERGYLYIVDRKKDMVITGGFNVYTREVEDALAVHPAVSSAAVFGVPDDKWGEAVVALVVLKAGANAAAAELIAHVRELKGPVQTPKQLHFTDKLPVTSLGKIDKKVLRSTYTKG